MTGGHEFALQLDLHGKWCVVIGGGAVATRKVDGLLAVGARVLVISPQLSQPLDERWRSGHIEWLARPYQSGDLQDRQTAHKERIWLVFAATNVSDVNAAVVAEARQLALFVSSASDPQTGDFSLPAVLRRGRLTLTVSTGGASPALTQHIRDELARHFGDEYATLLAFVAEMRDAFLKQGRRDKLQFNQWQEWLQLLREGDFDEKKAEIARALLQAADSGVAGGADGGADDRADEDAPAFFGEAQTVRTVRVGTRQSALAVRQTEQVVAQLQEICLREHLPFRFELKKMMTDGDRLLDVSLAKVGGKGLFVKQIEEALLAAEIDLAVHSMKDLPAQMPTGLAIGAVPKRVDARDVLILRAGALPDAHEALPELPSGAVVGTSSLRRAVQLRALRADLQIVPLRGNIDTRLRKLDEGQFDAIVLAAAGLRRMGWSDRATIFLAEAHCVPAVGQGALALQIRTEDAQLQQLLDRVDDARSRSLVSAERAMLTDLNGGCQLPIAGHATELADGYELVGLVGDAHGDRLLRVTRTGRNPEQLGREVAQALLELGAERLLRQVKG